MAIILASICFYRKLRNFLAEVDPHVVIDTEAEKMAVMEEAERESSGALLVPFRCIPSAPPVAMRHTSGSGAEHFQ